jgi:hypothetical protein
MDWQSPIALLIVAIALGAFIYSIAKPNKKSGCGKGCGCGVEKKDALRK